MASLSKASANSLGAVWAGRLAYGIVGLGLVATTMAGHVSILTRRPRKKLTEYMFFRMLFYRWKDECRPVHLNNRMNRFSRRSVAVPDTTPLLTQQVCKLIVVWLIEAFEVVLHFFIHLFSLSSSPFHRFVLGSK